MAITYNPLLTKFTIKDIIETVDETQVRSVDQNIVIDLYSLTDFNIYIVMQEILVYRKYTLKYLGNGNLFLNGSEGKVFLSHLQHSCNFEIASKRKF